MSDEEESGFRMIILWVIFITFILTFLTSSWLVTTVVFNDYVIYDLQTFIEDYNDKGYLSNDTVDLSDAMGESYQVWIYNSDRIFVLMYVIFIIETLLYSYFAKGVNMFSFFGILFYGMMIVLFLMSMLLNISQWFLDNFIIKLIPAALTILPNFAWFLERAGLILFVHLLLCLLVNKLDFDLLRRFSRKKKEQSVLAGDEI